MPYDATTYVSGWQDWAARNPRAHAWYTSRSAFDMSYRGTRGAGGAFMAGIGARMSQSAVGRSLKIGAAESFGVYYKGSIWANRGLVNEGFLGLARGTKLRRTWGVAGKTLTRSMRGPASAARALKLTGKAVSGTVFKAIPIIGTAAFAYQGYQEEGLWGAAKGVGESVLWSAAPRVLGSVGLGGLMGPAAAVVGTVAAVYGAQYAIGTAAREHVQKLRNLEMGGGQIMDAVQSAGAATMRQRSLSALQNTHVNGRMALGNEALLMHTPFR